MTHLYVAIEAFVSVFASVSARMLYILFRIPWPSQGWSSMEHGASILKLRAGIHKKCRSCVYICKTSTIP